MKNSIKASTALALSLALSACSSMGGPKSEMLYSAVESQKIAADLPVEVRRASDPVCATFYNNVAGYIAQPRSSGLGGNGLVKTIALGTLSGLVSGGVGSIGLGSTFAELAVASAASQVVYQTGDKVWDSTLGGTPDPKLKPSDGMLKQIEKATNELRCPTPDIAALTLRASAIQAQGAIQAKGAIQAQQAAQQAIQAQQTAQTIGN